MPRHRGQDGADSAAVGRALSVECSLERGCAGKGLFLEGDWAASSACLFFVVVVVGALAVVDVDVALSSLGVCVCVPTLRV
jgi:hypothetical protein